MESNHITYDYLKSFERIDEIISESENSFEELQDVPSRDRLTYTNGFYVNCSSLFVDIRGSSSLPEKHTRPKLAKLYRAYISEAVAVMNGNPSCVEITVVGDCVSGVFNTRYKPDIDRVFATGYQLASLFKVLNYKFEKAGIEQISVGIGVSYGRALMIKTGYKGSGINEVVWMGNVLNEASNLCGYGNKSYGDCQIMVSTVFYNNLNDDNQKLLSWNTNRSCYHGNVVSVEMEEWYNNNCQKRTMSWV